MTPQALKTIYLFRHLDPQELAAVANAARRVEAVPAQVIFAEGDAAESLYLVEMGSVRIIKRSESGTEEEIAVLASGSAFGEIALADRARRSATVVAAETSWLVEIPFAALDQLVAQQPSLGVKLYRAMAAMLSARLRETSQQYTELRGVALRHQ